MATLREVIEKLGQMPEGILDLDFAVFDSRSGIRTHFQKGTSEIRIVQSHGKTLVELQGESAPPFPGSTR